MCYGIYYWIIAALYTIHILNLKEKKSGLNVIVYRTRYTQQTIPIYGFAMSFSCISVSHALYSLIRSVKQTMSCEFYIKSYSCMKFSCYFINYYYLCIVDTVLFRMKATFILTKHSRGG